LLWSRAIDNVFKGEVQLICGELGVVAESISHGLLRTMTEAEIGAAIPMLFIEKKEALDTKVDDSYRHITYLRMRRSEERLCGLVVGLGLLLTCQRQSNVGVLGQEMVNVRSFMFWNRHHSEVQGYGRLDQVMPLHIAFNGMVMGATMSVPKEARENASRVVVGHPDRG
jgi:hypothetical protein